MFASQDSGPESKPPCRARREVLDEDVGSCEQPVHDPAGALFFEIEGHGLLRAVEPDEVAGEPFGDGVVGAGEVPASRALHLYDPRAEVGELAGGEGGRYRLLQGDDGYAAQRQHL